MSGDAEPGHLAAMLSAARRRGAPRRRNRLFRTPTGYVELRFWSGRRAWISIYDADGWPARRLTRWAARGEPSLARAFRRGGFSAEEAERVAVDASGDWGEPVGDVADVVIPMLIVGVLAAVGAVTIGRRLLDAAGVEPR